MTLFSRFALKRLATGGVLPRKIARMPGMTSLQERECLFRAALRIEPVGQIVVLGSWMGSLTASLAAGVMRNPRLPPGSTTVYAYDTFIWRDWMDPLARRWGVRRRYADGESFLPAFLTLTAKWKSVIEVRAGDVAALPWEGQPIAILVIDAMKDEATAKAIVSNFFPSLVAGESLVFQQDFAHFYTSWIHLIWWRMRDNLELIEDLPESGGSMYRYVREIPPERYAEILDFGSADDAEWTRAFANSRSLVMPEKVHMVAAAEVMRLVHAKRGKDAAAMAAWHSEQGNWGPEMELVMNRPEWQACASDHWTAGARAAP